MQSANSLRKRLAVLLLASLPLFADGRDVTGPTYGSSAYSVGEPVVATNGENFLTLWTQIVPRYEIYVFGSIADRHGVVTTPISFVVVPHARVLKVFASGNKYVALLLSERSVYRVAIISAEGKLLSLSSGGTSSGGVSSSNVAFDGNHFHLVGTRYNPTVHTVLHFVDMNGNMTEQTLASNPSGYDVAYSVAGAFVVFAADERGAFLQRYAGSGFPLSPRMYFSTDPNFNGVSVATNGSTFAVSWMVNTYGAGPNHVGNIAVVDANGAINGRSQQTFESQTGQAMLWNGATYLAVASTWSGQGSISKVDDNAKLFGSVSVSGLGVATAANADALYSIGNPFNSGSMPGTAIAIDTSGIHPAGTQMLSSTLRRQSVDALASDGLNYLVTWTDHPALFQQSIGAMYLSSEGGPLDPGQTDLNAVEQEGYSRSSVAFGKSVYLIVSQEGWNVVARRVMPGVGILDTSPILIAKAASVMPRSCAWNGDAFMVVWSSGAGSFATLIDEQGNTTRTTAIPAVGSVVWDGHSLLVASVYADYTGVVCTCPPRDAGIRVDRLTPDATLVDYVRISGSAQRIRIASSGRESLVIRDFGGIVSGIFIDTSERISASQPFQIFYWSDEVMSDVAWSGTAYTVAWHAGVSDVWWLSAADVYADSVVVPRGLVSTGPSEGLTSPPSIAIDSSGRALFALSEVPADAGVARVRTYSERDLHPAAPPPAPQIVAAIKDQLDRWTRTTVIWQSTATGVSGFSIERVDGTKVTPMTTVDGSARSVELPNADRVQIRAFGPGGISEPSAIATAVYGRRRATAH
jgi:hypothetical protein